MRKIIGVSFSGDQLNADIIESGLLTKKTVKSEALALTGAKEEKDLLIAGAFARWKKEHSPDGAVIGLPLQRFSHQLIEMPAMKRNDLKKALLFELEKYLPLPVDEYLFDFVALPGEPGRTKVLVLSVKKEVVREVTNMVAAAGIEVMAVRCNTLAAVRCLLDIAGEKNVNGLLVRSTGDGYEVSGVRNSVPAYLKGIPKGADLLVELERLSALYAKTVFCMGAVDHKIEERFSVRKFQPSVARELALSAARKGPLNLGFLPADLTRHSADPYPYLIGGLAGASLAIFLMTGVMVYYKEWRTLKDVEAKRAAVRARAAGVLAQRKKFDQLRNGRKELGDFREKSNVAIRTLSELSEVLPKDAWLINLAVDDKGKVEIEGFTSKTSSVISALEKSKAFKNIAFSAPILARDGEERFALKMEVEGL